MSTESKNLPAVQPPGTRSLAPAPSNIPQMFTLLPKDMAEAMSFSKLIADSTLCPEQFRGKPGDVLIATMIGAELGVSPLQSLANIAVINGRATIWGDLGIALVQKSGQLEHLIEEWDEDAQVSTVRIKRIGRPERVERFSMKDAARAGLAGKDLYKKYPQRMTGWRAKTYAIRGEFADVLKGLTIAEEAMDLPPPGPAIEVEPIQQPRAIELLVEEFRAPAQPAKGNGKGAAAQKRAPDRDEPPTRVESVKDREFKKKDGSAGRVWDITLKDGRKAGTFSETIATKARRAHNEGLPVIATTEPGAKGYLNLVDLSIHIPDDPAPADAGDDHGEPEAGES